MKALLTDWTKIMKQIPNNLMASARGETTMSNYSHEAQHMMRMMGWTHGQGIGKARDGIPEPVAAQCGQHSRAGLGSQKSKKPDRKRKQLLAVIKKVDGIDTIIYGYLKEHMLHVHELSIKGRPLPTNVYIHVITSELRNALAWGDGFCGIAESSFPHPKEWRLGAIDKDMDKVSVRDLTKEFTRQFIKEPTCKKAWEKRLGELNWVGIGRRYTVGIMTPKDFGSHFKLILHRAMFCNKHNPNATSPNCRLCGLHPESVHHFGTCITLKPIFQALRTIDKGTSWDDAKLNLLGEYDNRGTIPPGISMVHFNVWKFILIDITKKGIKDAPFLPEKVLKSSATRINKRLESIQYVITSTINRADARGIRPSFEAPRKWIRGLGAIDDEGCMSLVPSVSTFLDTYRKN